MEKINNCEALYKVEAKNSVLHIIYNKLRWGLWKEFNSDEEVADYICKDIDVAFENTVEKYSENSYILNIASVEDFGAFEDDIPDECILNFQLKIFMPLIHTFMVRALTGTL